MDNIKITVLDLTGCKYIEELHQRLMETFHFPDWYGKNWSAFWDLINDLPEEYTDVVIMGFTKLPADLQQSGKKMLEIMQRNKEYYDEYLKKHPDYGYQFNYRIID